jgi:hypothetical protein
MNDEDYRASAERESLEPCILSALFLWLLLLMQFLTPDLASPAAENGNKSHWISSCMAATYS